MIVFRFLIALLVVSFGSGNAHISQQETYGPFLNSECLYILKPYIPAFQAALDAYGLTDQSTLSLKATNHPLFIMYFTGTPAYYAFHDTIVYPLLAKPYSEDMLSFSLAHELAHRKYNHVQLQEAFSWSTFIGSFIYAGSRIKNSCIPFLRKIPGVRRLPLLAGLLCIQKLADLQLSRYCEKHADLTAAQKMGVKGGIEWIHRMQETENIIHQGFKEDASIDKISSWRLSLALNVDNISLFRQHPLMHQRLAYLKKYQETKKVPFIYRLPDLLPFWPKKIN